MNKVERHMDICKSLNKIYEQKNHDYGDSFHDTFVEEGMAMARIRLSDKLNRFKKLSKAGSEQKVNDESIRDTLMDLANYAIMTVMEMDILAEENKRERLGEKLSKMRDAWEEWEARLPQNFTANDYKTDADPDPCEKCTYQGKGIGCECVDRVEWEMRQRRDTDAAEAEQADGR